MDRHTDREYEQELETLRELVLMMGARVEELSRLAMRAFSTGNVALARSTVELDEQVDRLEMQIDELCILVLARRQPVASDLRFVTTTLKLVTDLERIGDLGVNICERVIELDQLPPPELARSLERMSAMAHAMLREALDAYVARDVIRAETVVERDFAVDAAYAQLFPELVAQMMAAPINVAWATRLQSIGKCLERIADHATNIAEMVVFMVRGQDVRHPPALQSATHSGAAPPVTAAPRRSEPTLD